MENENVFDIAKMSSKLGISENSIKVTLGIPLDTVCKMASSISANEEFNKSPEDSESEQAAWLRWNELCSLKIKSAKTLEKVKQIRQDCPDESTSLEEAFLKEISLCSTLEEIVDLVYDVPENSRVFTAYLKRRMELANSLGELKKVFGSCPEKSEIKTDVLQKWTAISYLKITDINVDSEMETIFSDLSPRSLSSALDRWLIICVNAKEVQKLYQFLFEARRREYVYDEYFRIKLLGKWRELSSTELQKANTFDEIIEVLSFAPDNFDIRIEISKKGLDIASEFSDLEVLFVYAPKNFELKIAIFNKWLDSVENIWQAKRMYTYFNDELEDYYILDSTKIIHAILKKIATFFGYKENKV
jgi:chorismate mutase